MWSVLVTGNAVLWVLSAVYMVYSFGIAILTWSWKQFFLALLVFAFLSVAEVALGAISDW